MFTVVQLTTSTPHIPSECKRLLHRDNIHTRTCITTPLHTGKQTTMSRISSVNADLKNTAIAIQPGKL